MENNLEATDKDDKEDTEAQLNYIQSQCHGQQIYKLIGSGIKGSRGYIINRLR